ncbi:PREDICTED: agamous-like MADS-box protein AGL62 [Camelina sativa]|uniref:Agamous-like MADS-box protein AGL62 n=1 Tax=Camelina sativa TaxID=90675 RepID=A0ABM0TVQ0_CAMSA|nr:PREDICTED: agamous-like MADS-box protein AGL62 [Camelina sativa]
MVRSNKGRQKIQMKKMRNESNLQVTFSKRRFGLFKKASELCTLCGAEILMIVFSPGGKVFSFGHPGVRELIYRFLNFNHNSLIPHQPNNNLQLVDSRPDRNIQYLNEMLTHVLAKQEKAKHNRMSLNMVKQSREQRGICWYEKDVKEFDLTETDDLIGALQDVRKKLVSDMSHYPQLNVSHQNYMGETAVFGGGGNVDVGGIDLFDQRMNTFNYNPIMGFPNQTPLFGYNNDGVIVPSYNMNYMSSYNFN